MRLRRRKRQSPVVYVTEQCGDTRGRVTALLPGDTMAINHRITINDGDLHIDRETHVADIRVGK